MNRPRRARTDAPWGWIVVTAATCLSAGCTRSAPPSPGTAPSASSATAPPAVGPAASAIAHAEAPAVDAKPPIEREERAESTASAGVLGALVVDAPVPVAPAGPAAASSHGIVVVKRNGEAVVARLAPTQPTGKSPVTTAIAPLEVAPEALFRTVPPPAIAGSTAYFVHGGALRRVMLPAGGAGTPLASDARDGGRVAATLVSTGEGAPRAAVAYLSETPTRMVAKLWVEGAPAVLTLTPDGAAATCTALAAVDAELLALTMEARTGMSTVHARRVTFAGATPDPGEDVVVWVGGTAQSFTEVTALAGRGDESWAFTAVEHDATRFGLARIRIARTPEHGAEVYWRDYPNGLDPAPLAAARFCGHAIVLYARPASPTPRAPQELCAAALDAEGLGPCRVVAAAPAFAGVTVAPLPGGALLGYLAEGSTWAASLRCPTEPER